MNESRSGLTAYRDCLAVGGDAALSQQAPAFGLLTAWLLHHWRHNRSWLGKDDQAYFGGSQGLTP